MSINKKKLNQLGLFSPQCDKNDVVAIVILREKQYEVDVLQMYVEVQTLNKWPTTCVQFNYEACTGQKW